MATDEQQLVALDSLIVPRLSTVSGEDGSGHTCLAPSLVTMEDYFDRVLANAGVQTLADMKFIDFCTAPSLLSFPVRQCFFLAVLVIFLYFNHALFYFITFSRTFHLLSWRRALYLTPVPTSAGLYKSRAEEQALPHCFSTKPCVTQSARVACAKEASRMYSFLPVLRKSLRTAQRRSLYRWLGVFVPRLASCRAGAAVCSSRQIILSIISH